MSSNTDAFAKSYLPGARLPIPLKHGWSLESLRPDRIRPGAIDLVMRDTGGAQVLGFAEWRIDGRQSLAATKYLLLSYYEPDSPVDQRLLGEVIRDLAASFARLEETLDAEELKQIFQLGERSEQQERASHPIELRINRDCNEDCLFCNTPPDSNAILEGREQILSEMQRFYDLGHRVVTFTGREPTLDPNLEDYIRRARETGYQQIRLQTNGTAFSNKDLLQRLVDAGLGRVQLSLHTMKKPVFEVLVGPPRLLDKALLGLKHMMEIPRLQVEILCVITALNVGELEELTRTLVADYRPRPFDLVFSPVAPQGDGEKHPELFTRLSVLGPAVGKAIAIAQDADLTAYIPGRCGMPLCVTPPEFRDRNVSYYASPGDNLEGGKKKSPKCVSCAIDDRCSGVWSRYLDLFGDAELMPLDVAPQPSEEDKRRRSSL